MSSGYYPPLESNGREQTRRGAGDILVTKRSILSNPGTKIDNSLYYSALNTTVQVSEITWTTGRFSQSLQSLAFGSTSTITIPNGSFLQNVMLHLELPPLPINCCLPRGWGFAAINSINFLLGSSNVPQISLTGQTLFQIIMAQCETVSKRNEVLALAGQETFVPLSLNSGPLTENTVADLVLPLPFSGMAGPDHQLPFDTSLLQNPITIQINFNPREAFLRGIGASAITAFAGASAQCRLGDMLNRDQGLRRIMQADSDLILGYPFMHYQSFQTNFNGVSLNPAVSGFSPTFVSINLLGFINADLVGIIFGCVKSVDQTGTSSVNPVNPLKYEEVSNVQLLFNGLVMHATPKQQHKLTNMNTVLDASYVYTSFTKDPTSGGTWPFTSAAYNNYPVFIDFSQKRTMNFNFDYENTWRVPNNTITLQLNTPVGTDNTQYTLYATYIYNSICNIKGGESDIFFS